MDGALLVIDLDRFKQVNDGHGHRAGDRVLAEVASVLRERLRESDILARFGGDEFAVLMPHGGAPEAAELANLVVNSVRRDVATPAGPLDASVGWALFEAATTSSDEVLSRADDAMYADKASGGGRRGICGRWSRGAPLVPRRLRQPSASCTEGGPALPRGARPPSAPYTRHTVRSNSLADQLVQPTNFVERCDVCRLQWGVGGTRVASAHAPRQVPRARRRRLEARCGGDRGRGACDGRGRGCYRSGSGRRRDERRRARRAAGGARAARGACAQQACWGGVHGAGHARPADGRAAGAFAAPALSGGAPRRRHHWPDPAHQRRRPRRPPDPSALRGEEGVSGTGSAGPDVAAGAPSAARRGRAGGRAYRARAGSPARARRSGADDPRGSQAPGTADGAKPWGIVWSSSSGSRSARSVSAASSRARAAASRGRRWSGCGAFRSRAPSAAAGRARGGEAARSAAASALGSRSSSACHSCAIRAAITARA